MKNRKTTISRILLAVYSISVALIILGCRTESTKARRKKKASDSPNETQTKSVQVEQTGISDEITNLKLGEKAKDNDHYSGLAAVRSLDTVQTVLGDFSESISSSQEVLYPIIEVYNPGDAKLDCNTIAEDRWNMELYVDSAKAPRPDVRYYVAVDDYRKFDYHIVDSQRSILFVDAFVVEKGWSSIQIFFGNVAWTITPDDVSYSTYIHKSLFDHDFPNEITEPGTVLYSGKDYELVFDGFEFCQSSKAYYSKNTYAVFMFTINNISDKELECDCWSWRSLCYNDFIRTDQYEGMITDIFDGHENLSDVRSIRAGMKAKVYIAYEVKSTTGLFECYFDTGYCYGDNLIGYVCVQA